MLIRRLLQVATLLGTSLACQEMTRASLIGSAADPPERLHEVPTDGHVSRGAHNENEFDAVTAPISERQDRMNCRSRSHRIIVDTLFNIRPMGNLMPSLSSQLIIPQHRPHQNIRSIRTRLGAGILRRIVRNTVPTWYKHHGSWASLACID